MSDINTENIIHKVEKYPALWYSSSDKYSYKIEKKKAWNTVILHFIEDFEGRSPAQRNKLGK